MVSMMSRRIIQLRLDISVGCEAIGTSASMKPACCTPQIQVCMPPMELPSTRRRRRCQRDQEESQACCREQQRSWNHGDLPSNLPATLYQPSGELVEPRKHVCDPSFDPRNKSEGKQAQDCVEGVGLGRTHS